MKKQLAMILAVTLMSMFVIGSSAFAGEEISAKSANAQVDGNTIMLNVSKMTCGSCVKHVTEVLSKVDGVEKVDVNLKNGTATVVCDKSKNMDPAKLAEVVTKAGYPTTLAKGATCDGKKMDKKDAEACVKKGCDPAACGMTAGMKSCGGKR